MPITMTPGDMKYRDENGVYHDLNYIKGDVIDDTAGVGDTNKTFSADKLTTDYSNLLSAISNVEKVISGYTLSQGSINSSTGADSNSTTRCRTNYISFSGFKMIVTPKDGYKIGGRIYTNTSGSFVSGTSFDSNPKVFTDNTKYYRFIIAKTDDSTIAPADLPSDAITIKQFFYTDDSLTLGGKSADAKATGDAIVKDNERLTKIDGSILPPPYAIGVRYVENNADKWATNTKRMSFEEGKYITLKKDDIVSRNTSFIAQFGGGYSTDIGETFTSISSRTNDYTAPANGIYFFWTQKLNNADFTNDDVKNAYNALYFKREPNTVKTVEYLKTNVDPLISVPTTLTNGYYGSNGAIQEQTEDKEKYTQKYTVVSGMTFSYSLDYTTASHDMWIAVGEWKNDGTFNRSDLVSGSKRSYSGTYSPGSDVAKVSLMFRGFDDFTFALTTANVPFLALQSELINQFEPVTYAFDSHRIKGINHRGMNRTAPENTIPAYQLSVEEGFSFVETDVRFTSDGVAVLLHDATVDRTSDGTGNIADMTYAQALELDFGSWKAETYAGTKIPTFEEFILFCRNTGLFPYIEVSGAEYTSAQISGLISIVKRYNMQRAVTWISFYKSNLEKVVAYDPCARVGRLPSNDLTTGIANSTVNLKTGKNEAFINIDVQYADADTVAICKDYGLPLEVWTVNTSADMLALPNYVSGITSDTLNFEEVAKDNALT